MIWAVVLAAGESRRMGEPKLLLPYGESTIVGGVIQNILASRVDRVVVVLGSRWPKIRKAIQGYNVQIVVNRRFSEGMLSSIQRGLSTLPRTSRAAIIALGDQPAIPAWVVDALIESYQREKKGLVVPVYRGKRGHPLLVDLKYREEIFQLDPAVGLRQLLERHPEDVLECRVSTPTVLKDIDDLADYRRLKEAQTKGS